MKYTRERLDEAARHSTSIAGVLRYLGITPSGGMHTYLRRRLQHFGIDTSHFTHRRCIDDADFVNRLRDAASGSTSVCETMRRLGRRPSSSGQTRLRNQLNRLNIDTSHFTGQAHMRGKPARNRLSPREILVLRPEGTAREAPARLRRALIESGVSQHCDSCGIGTTWQDQPLTLHVDHINGQVHDCRLTNLRFLCPNCHSQTWNYAGRGKRDPHPAVTTLAG